MLSESYLQNNNESKYDYTNLFANISEDGVPKR